MKVTGLPFYVLMESDARVVSLYRWAAAEAVCQGKDRLGTIADLVGFIRDRLPNDSAPNSPGLNAQSRDFDYSSLGMGMGLGLRF